MARRRSGKRTRKLSASLRAARRRAKQPLPRTGENRRLPKGHYAWRPRKTGRG